MSGKPAKVSPTKGLTWEERFPGKPKVLTPEMRRRFTALNYFPLWARELLRIEAAAAERDEIVF